MKLLVSVVSAEEARRAVAGGADIVDVKDPGEGALGAPAPRVLSDVVSAVGAAAPVSVALGDMPNLPHTAALAARGAALSGAAYVKVGLRGVRSLCDAVALMGAVGDAVGPGVGVIAAAYADFDSLDPPAFAPVLLPELVRATGIAGALVDTFVKDGRGLYGWLSLAEVADLVARTRAAGGSFGVAGQLRLGRAVPRGRRRGRGPVGGVPRWRPRRARSKPNWWRPRWPSSGHWRSSLRICQSGSPNPDR